MLTVIKAEANVRSIPPKACEELNPKVEEIKAGIKGACKRK
jgi:hypothetical protein